MCVRMCVCVCICMCACVCVYTCVCVCVRGQSDIETHYLKRERHQEMHTDVVKSKSNATPKKLKNSNQSKPRLADNDRQRECHQWSFFSHYLPVAILLNVRHLVSHEILSTSSQY
ncbi:hypothetical protein LSH36_256g03008 [Paralvinella palmiformis]|uniref:Secreted protein n=1 Tax=Paralvinella palmiformis TaxID=53620 RepID=A0AAD9JKT8_9ANNE|nr:hypothetical protein LSH36_256g03008 [Paralvinella palmiformis]